MEDRRRPTYFEDERQLLERWLDFHRSTLIFKCDGLTDQQRKSRPVADSLLSLHGIVRHLAETERNWFQRIFLRQADLPSIWSSPASSDGALYPLDDAHWADDLAIWTSQCEKSREAASGRDLSESGIWRDKTVVLRSVYLHMIQEYARHNGHADLIRELIDGATGL